ncbi:histidine kinase [Asanoa ishikariensis]|uniref:histidine kinase n=1 Tax=Asanoa ishikariensis TaxID=137265 RepID=A0A1H3UC08_9ACTN|nr:sensor histidine kinase [Asanoa ishikariensis]GIF63932.1 histidine kinase [Asanoa ishikariensis]SDZ59601.1 Signal transduction histidine kinase [Asanoa ishikariensis]
MSRFPDAWSAVRGRPVRFLTSVWPWRALAYVASTLPIGLAWLLVMVVVLGVGVATIVVVAGLFVLAGLPTLAHLAARGERWRIRLVIPGRRGPLAPRDGRRPLSWPEMGVTVLLATLFWLVDAVALVLLTAPVVLLLAPLLVRYDTLEVAGWRVDGTGKAWAAVAVGLVALVLVLYAITALACGQAALVRQLLDPPEARLVEAVAQLRKSRSGLVDAFETERRRIERDLHDGVQQRLVALTMTLGSAELDLPSGPGLELVREAHQQAEQALADLRTTIRGIHPQVLTDHGLAAAVHEIAGRSPVPVHLDLAVEGRLPPAIEAAAYFFVSESLTNVAKHAHARSAQVHAWTSDGTLVVSVVDDGIGGADPQAGTGLAGLRARLDALDGELDVTSPAGGPTQVRMTCQIQ